MNKISKVSAEVESVVEHIKKDAIDGKYSIISMPFSWVYGRSATSAAFRIALQREIIEVKCKSVAGSPIYQAHKNLKKVS